MTDDESRDATNPLNENEAPLTEATTHKGVSSFSHFFSTATASSSETRMFLASYSMHGASVALELAELWEWKIDSEALALVSNAKG
jgi:hypothetical protein